MLVVVLAVTALGCGGNKNRFLRRSASVDLACPESQIHLTTTSKADAQYRAAGCGRSALYTYSKGQGAMRISPVEGINAAPPQGNVVAPPPPPPPAL
jgi:hypothetical protein